MLSEVVIRILDAERNLPLVIEAQGRNAPLESLISWYGANRADLEGKLLEHGALLFRGFAVRTPSAFARFVKSISDDLLGYVDGNSPRTRLTDGIYTSTEYPPEFSISLHNELSYSRQWPNKLFFCCIVAPRSGGETPIADSRAILKALCPEIVEEFARRRVKYIRNLHGGRGLGLSWQDTFETTERAAVEQFCLDAAIDFEWQENGGLRLIQIGAGVAIHPKTGESVWFNQADQFHPSNNPIEVVEAMHRIAADKLPQNACFGDGAPIEASILDKIRETVRQHAVCFPWQEGDVLMIDNMLVCHGRMPYTGPRKILVAMH